MANPDNLQGALELLILKTLRRGANHGFALSSHIQRTSAAVLRVEAGSLYPALHRMTEAGLLKAAWRTTDVQEQTKTEASSAPVPVIPQLAKYLEAHRNEFSAEFIFSGPKMGRPLDLHNLANRTIRPALKAAGIPWCGWHGFRRGLSTTLYELGTDARTRQAILRHANASVTEKHYTKAVDAVSTAAMAKVEAAFNKKLKARKA